MTPVGEGRLNLFVSYHRTDRRWVSRLRKHTRQLTRNQIVDYWDESRIKAGDDWRAEIQAAIERARVAVLFVSADFLDSDLLANDELPRLLSATARLGLKIIPVVVGPCLIPESILRFKAINPPNQPLIGMSDAESERTFSEIARAIAQVATEPEMVPNKEVDTLFDADPHSFLGWTIPSRLRRKASTARDVPDATDDVQESVLSVTTESAPVALLCASVEEQRVESYLITEGQVKISAGRSVDCDIVIDDVKVSRRHFILEINAGGPDADIFAADRSYCVTVVDARSENGTYVNGDCLNQERRILRSGDVLAAGNWRAQFCFLRRG